jgi:hypothetical protein
MIKKPVIPEHVCPYVDMAIELIENNIEQEDKNWRLAQATLAIALLEHVRLSAEKLRASSQFWYDKSKREGRKNDRTNPSNKERRIKRIARSVKVS